MNSDTAQLLIGSKHNKGSIVITDKLWIYYAPWCWNQIGFYTDKIKTKKNKKKNNLKIVCDRLNEYLDNKIQFIDSYEKDIKKILNDVKSMHPKAKHFPYAYILGTTAGKTDDKEPHNSAGMQIYNILNYNNLNSHLLIIIRYFGGTKLGASNLLRTYLEVAKNTVKKITN